MKTLPIKKTRQEQSIKIWYEHLSINHNGVRIDFAVDYQNMNISILDNVNNKKQFMFCERSLSYEQGWYNILDAIKEAMKIGFDKLRVRQEQNEKEKLEMFVELEKEKIL